MAKINKNWLIGIIVIFLVFGGVVVWVLIQKQRIPPKLEIPQEIPVKKEKTMEEILKDLTVPQATETPEVPKDLIKSLTAPTEKGVPEVPKEIIEQLTPPR